VEFERYEQRSSANRTAHRQRVLEATRGGICAYIRLRLTRHSRIAVLDFQAGICKYCVYARATGAVNMAPHKHGYVIRTDRSRRARLFPLTIEVGPIATDGCDVTVHRQPHSAKSMKYLTALLIPYVVHESAPRRKFISREVRRWPEHASPGPRVSPTIIEFLRYIFALLYVRRCRGKYSRRLTSCYL